MKTLALAKTHNIGANLYGSLGADLFGRYSESEPSRVSKTPSEQASHQCITADMAVFGKATVVPRLDCEWLHHTNKVVDSIEYVTVSKAPYCLSHQDLVLLNTRASVDSRPNTARQLISYLDVGTNIHDFDAYSKIIYPPQSFIRCYRMTDDPAHFSLAKRIMHFAGHAVRAYGIDLPPASAPIEETPAIRAKRLLNDFEASIRHRKPLADRSRVLEILAARSAEVREELRKVLTGHTHPHLRWLAIEILAALQWQELGPILERGLREWDRQTEREAWLGAVVTIRKHPVPKELRASVADTLRSSLESVTTSALSGHDVEQTEVVCEAIDTFRSFAEPADLFRLRRFWQPDCTFTVQVRAIDAASMVTRRFPDDSQTDQFFVHERECLEERFCDLARERMVAIENGTLLWRVAGLLLARLGEEASSVVPAAKKHRSLIGRLRRLVRESELNLIRNKREVWLGQQRDFVTSLREKLANLENQ